jgi:hypothetical protein
MDQRINTGHPPGTVALAAGMQPRYFEFVDSLDNLQVPAGTIFNRKRSCDVAMNFNNATRAMKGDWVFYLGDDHSFQSDLLFRLLNFNVDVVVPISPCKVFPFAPCVIHGPEDGSLWHDDMPLYTWAELSQPGLFALPKGDFIGQAGMLVRKHVLDAIGDPWFKSGQIVPGRMHEDLWFCHEIQELGFTVWIDCETIFEHWFPLGITARKHEGEWVPALRSGPGVIVLPDAKPMNDENTGVPVDGQPRLTWEKLDVVRPPNGPAGG